jgi:transcriptional regulator with XRE-family HTH domain
MSALRRIRVDQRLSIARLAELSGVSPEQIRNIERGDVQNPRPVTLGKLADVLGCSPSTLDPQSTQPEAEAA